MVKVLSGLHPFNESVWPGVRNDLFVAHDSIYLFSSQFAQGSRALDGACGTGYGSKRLLDAGAVSVTGLDIDPASVRFARRHYPDRGLEFRVDDLETAAFQDGEFDLVVSSNTLEHLQSPAGFVQRLRSALTAHGVAVVALPPIYSEADVRTHQGIAYHRSSLSVRAWYELFASSGWSVALYGQRVAPGSDAPDFASPFASRLCAGDFSFVSLGLEAFYEAPSIGAVYVLRRVA